MMSKCFLKNIELVNFLGEWPSNRLTFCVCFLILLIHFLVISNFLLEKRKITSLQNLNNNFVVKHALKHATFFFFLIGYQFQQKWANLF